jgi:hypothetical protein
MAQDHNNIYSIVERLRILDEGLDKNQKSVNQLSATFKPKTVAVLTARRDPKNPLAGKLVGGAEESVDHGKKPVDEDVLDRVKQSFADYLKTVSDEIKSDTDLKDKIKGDSDIKSKDRKDRALVAKKAVAEDPTQDEPAAGMQSPGTQEPMVAESPVKAIAMEDGAMCEIHGNMSRGFEIRHGNRSLPTRFKNIEEAEMALEMFAHRRRKQDAAQDYIEEK